MFILAPPPFFFSFASSWALCRATWEFLTYKTTLHTPGESKMKIENHFALEIDKHGVSIVSVSIMLSGPAGAETAASPAMHLFFRHSHLANDIKLVIINPSSPIRCKRKGKLGETRRSFVRGCGRPDEKNAESGNTSGHHGGGRLGNIPYEKVRFIVWQLLATEKKMDEMLKWLTRVPCTEIWQLDAFYNRH